MPKPILHCLMLENYSILEQLQLEEALLRTDKHNWCLINERTPPAIVMGISGKHEELIDAKTLSSSPIPVIRRFSGGGTVVVDEHTLFITMICNREAVDVHPFPNSILCWNGSLYKTALKRCDFHIRENDYAIGTKKFGGNAQYICKDRWLHHSTLLWNFDVKKMHYLKMPPKMPDYRQGRAHEEFLCALSSQVDCKKTFLQDFLGSAGKYFHLKEESMDEAKKRLDLPHRRATTLV